MQRLYGYGILFFSEACGGGGVDPAGDFEGVAVFDTAVHEAVLGGGIVLGVVGDGFVGFFGECWVYVFGFLPHIGGDPCDNLAFPAASCAAEWSTRSIKVADKHIGLAPAGVELCCFFGVLSGLFGVGVGEVFGFSALDDGEAHIDFGVFGAVGFEFDGFLVVFDGFCGVLFFVKVVLGNDSGTGCCGFEGL